MTLASVDSHRPPRRVEEESKNDAGASLPVSLCGKVEREEGGGASRCTVIRRGYRCNERHYYKAQAASR